MFKRRNLALLVTMPALLLSSLVAQAAEYPKGKLDCSVFISRTEVGFIVGLGGGHGRLYCADAGTHPFRIGGFQIGSMGLAGANAEGQVYGLTKVSDFEGTYTRAEASISAIAGAGRMSLSNPKGVVMVLDMATAGANVTLGGGGLRVRFE